MDKAQVTYFDKDVYVGLDVHKKSYTVVARCDGLVVKKATTPADGIKLTESLKHWFTGARVHSVYEAGFSGYCLHRQLTRNGIDNIIINAASIEIAANDRKKCDKRDADKLSEQLAVGRLCGIYIPTIEEETKRQITRTRQEACKERRRAAHRIKSKLHYFGYIRPDDDRFMSKKFVCWINSLDLPEEVRWSLDMLIEQWSLFSRQVNESEAKMAKLFPSDPRIEEIYLSAPGIGFVSATILSQELGNLAKRFKSQDALFQYTGLTPAEYSSGEHIRQGHIDKQGPSRIRHILVEISWRAVKVDVVLKECFERIAGRRGKKIAIVAIARKLIGRIRGCFLHNQLYAEGLIA